MSPGVNAAGGKIPRERTFRRKLGYATKMDVNWQNRKRDSRISSNKHGQYEQDVLQRRNSREIS
jgi:hypothetical protein